MKKKTLSHDGIDFPQEQTENTHNPSFNSGQVQTTRIFKRKEKKKKKEVDSLSLKKHMI